MTCLASATRAAVLQASRRELVTAASGAVVSLADVKGRVGQKLDDDDLVLQDLEEEAHRWAEAYLGRSILRQTWREWFDGPFRGAVLLLYEAAAAITSVKVYSLDDTETTVAPTVYQADLVSQPARLVLRYGQQWPIGLRAANAIAVEYTAGWETHEVPSVVRAGIVRMVSEAYGGDRAIDPSAGVRAALNPYRLRTGLA